jgi:drug/metabolite transporter (DMT)-like permease
VAFRRGALCSGFHRLGWLALYTVAELSGPWVLIGYAERHVSSSTAGLIIALTPILAAACATTASAGAFSTRRMLGLAAGLTGVAALMGFDTERPHWLAFAALALSAVGYALGPLVVARKLSDRDATGVVAASLVLAALFYLPAVPAHWPASFPVAATASVVALAALCTAFAFTMLFALVNEVGAARATLVAYINPAVAVLLGVLVLGEPFSPATVIGCALVAIGTFLATHEP